MIRIGQDAASYLERNVPSSEIYGGFHEHYQLDDPFMGYVTQPLDVHPCYRFERHRSAQWVYLHRYEPEQPVCNLVVTKTGAHRVQRFESNGKWLELWRVPPP
jgi:hypothetical protein